MVDWPGNPVALMWVKNLEGYTESNINYINKVTRAILPDDQITFRIPISFEDRPQWDNGIGFFRASIFRVSGAQETQLASKEISLGDDNTNGFYTGLIELNVTMSSAAEAYRLELFCETRKTSLGSSVGPKNFNIFAIRQVTTGTFRVDFLPISIVYCPPNQDMNASLTQSSNFGTRTTIGTSADFIAESQQNTDIYGGGVKIGGRSTTNSRRVSNASSVGIEVSYFRNTVVTADNQRAIGRAYWGPLGDLFVIAVNPRFTVMQLPGSSTFTYSAVNEPFEIIIVPAYKLLRPSDDDIQIKIIPQEVRRRLLELDPFITNLDRFFPDSGAPLSDAANPYADPSSNNRAELIGKWWLKNATELNYSIGERKELRTAEANELVYQATLTDETGGGLNLSGFGFSRIDRNTYGAELGFQSSLETVTNVSLTASCYLIRNQNEKDLSGVEIYYDKIFSTLMFRKIKNEAVIRPAPLPPLIIYPPKVRGTVTDTNGVPIWFSPVQLIDNTGTVRRVVSTSIDGKYEITSPGGGDYTVRCLNVSSQVFTLPPPTSQQFYIYIDLTGVKRRFPLPKTSAWEVSLLLGLSSDDIWKISRNLDKIFDEEDLAAVCELDNEKIKDITNRLDRLDISWPETLLDHLGGISKQEVKQLQNVGIESLQDLWRKGKTKSNLASIAKKANMNMERLNELVARAEKTRASKYKEIST